MDYAVWYLVAIVFFKCLSFPRACERGYLPFFAGGCHRPAFFVVYWFVVLSVGLCCFHNIVFFLYICRVCSSIYKMCLLSWLFLLVESAWFHVLWMGVYFVAFSSLLLHFHLSTVSHVRLGRLHRRNWLPNINHQFGQALNVWLSVTMMLRRNGIEMHGMACV